MKLDQPFIKLPYRFDHARLLEETLRIPREQWQHHPGRHAGNYAIPLISVDGGMNDKFAGRMRPTAHLAQMPYTAQVIASFGEVVSRSRIMIIEGRQSLPMHTDINYHWFKRVRIHIPLQTNPDVIFTSHDEQAHLPAGEAWLLDTWHSHQVVNDSDETRIHLVVDTTGSSRFWNTARNAQQLAETRVDYEPGKQVSILAEQFNVPFVMSPGEVDGLVSDLVEDLASHTDNPAAAVDYFRGVAGNFVADWRQVYSVFGPSGNGIESYRNLINATYEALGKLPGVLLLRSNNANAVNTLNARVLQPALNVDMAQYYEQVT